ncbi:hypothetical protein EVAR_76469_1 [Eumeta japonica]|uniref:Uncharacterized protein n=1 Tax=Eumeta variegata TaxID=151549 RepID=A0A4C1T7A3_EUMVA|nr:hypothetical protein EVAR_76469_1 [Eumeta japonica]
MTETPSSFPFRSEVPGIRTRKNEVVAGGRSAAREFFRSPNFVRTDLHSRCHSKPRAVHRNKRGDPPLRDSSIAFRLEVVLRLKVALSLQFYQAAGPWEASFVPRRALAVAPHVEKASPVSRKSPRVTHGSTGRPVPRRTPNDDQPSADDVTQPRRENVQDDNRP